MLFDMGIQPGERRPIIREFDIGPSFTAENAEGAEK